MVKLSLTSIGPLLLKKRSGRGIREVAAEIGISSATLSRVENGKIPDLETFSKLCKWLNVDPGEILGCKCGDKIEQPKPMAVVAAHFRADRTLRPETVNAMAEMILRARGMIEDGQR